MLFHFGCRRGGPKTTHGPARNNREARSSSQYAAARAATQKTGTLPVSLDRGGHGFEVRASLMKIAVDEKCRRTRDSALHAAVEVRLDLRQIGDFGRGFRFRVKLGQGGITEHKTEILAVMLLQQFDHHPGCPQYGHA